jgi:hypothetical protein
LQRGDDLRRATSLSLFSTLTPLSTSFTPEKKTRAISTIEKLTDYLTKVVVQGKQSSSLHVREIMTARSKLLTVPPQVREGREREGGDKEFERRRESPFFSLSLSLERERERERVREREKEGSFPGSPPSRRSFPPLTPDTKKKRRFPSKKKKPSQSSVVDVMGLMVENNIRHVPVVEGGSFLGMVSIRDVVTTMLEEHREEVGRLHEYISGSY